MISGHAALLVKFIGRVKPNGIIAKEGKRTSVAKVVIFTIIA